MKGYSLVRERHSDDLVSLKDLRFRTQQFFYGFNRVGEMRRLPVQILRLLVHPALVRDHQIWIRCVLIEPIFDAAALLPGGRSK